LIKIWGAISYYLEGIFRGGGAGLRPCGSMGVAHRWHITPLRGLGDAPLKGVRGGFGGGGWLPRDAPLNGVHFKTECADGVC
jgi:hypothetical protein